MFSHSPFSIENAFDQLDPIFINKEPVKAYSDIHRFPPEKKADKENFQLSLIGYKDHQMMTFTKLAGGNDVDELISEIFETKPEVAYLHARNAEARLLYL